MSNKLVFATNNAHKIAEISAILGEKFQLVSLRELNCFEDIPETCNTFQGNALQKAHYVSDKFGVDCFADDSGLEVEVLNGEPGVFSARYAGDGHDSEANMCKLLQKLEGNSHRRAQFRTVIALLLKGKEYLFEGIITGTIIEEKRGTNGFGYDPIFIPDGYDKTFAELGDNIKNKISHRAIAINKLVDFLTMQ